MVSRYRTDALCAFSHDVVASLRVPKTHKGFLLFCEHSALWSILLIQWLCELHLMIYKNQLRFHNYLYKAKAYIVLNG